MAALASLTVCLTDNIWIWFSRWLFTVHNYNVCGLFLIHLLCWKLIFCPHPSSCCENHVHNLTLVKLLMHPLTVCKTWFRLLWMVTLFPLARCGCRQPAWNTAASIYSISVWWRGKMAHRNSPRRVHKPPLLAFLVLGVFRRRHWTASLSSYKN